MSQLLSIVITALVTSAVTLGAAWLVFQRYLKNRINAAVDAKAAELSTIFEARVRDGVRRGIRDGLTDLPGDVVRRTRRGITDPVGVIGDGLNSILGSSGRRRED